MELTYTDLLSYLEEAIVLEIILIIRLAMDISGHQPKLILINLFLEGTISTMMVREDIIFLKKEPRVSGVLRIDK